MILSASSAEMSGLFLCKAAIRSAGMMGLTVGGEEERGVDKKKGAVREGAPRYSSTSSSSTDAVSGERGEAMSGGTEGGSGVEAAVGV